MEIWGSDILDSQDPADLGSGSLGALELWILGVLGSCSLEAFGCWNLRVLGFGILGWACALQHGALGRWSRVCLVSWGFDV